MLIYYIQLYSCILPICNRTFVAGRWTVIKAQNLNVCNYLFPIHAKDFCRQYYRNLLVKGKKLTPLIKLQLCVINLFALLFCSLQPPRGLQSCPGQNQSTHSIPSLYLQYHVICDERNFFLKNINHFAGLDWTVVKLLNKLQV